MLGRMSIEATIIPIVCRGRRTAAGECVAILTKPAYCRRESIYSSSTMTKNGAELCITQMWHLYSIAAEITGVADSLEGAPCGRSLNVLL